MTYLFTKFVLASSNLRAWSSNPLMQLDTHNRKQRETTISYSGLLGKTNSSMKTKATIDEHMQEYTNLKEICQVHSMRTKKRILTNHDLCCNSLSKLSLSNPLHEYTKIKMMILWLIISPFTMEIPSIYRFERHNHHENMKDIVEDMVPWGLDQTLRWSHSMGGRA